MNDTVGRFGSGQAVRRLEDGPLLAGAGRFTNDEALPGQAHLVFLRSPHAHARIMSVDTSAARAMPGVVAILTGEDVAAAGLKSLGVALPFKRPDGSDLAAPPRPILAHGLVRFVGEPVAAIIAESAAAARDAAEVIMVDYEELPAVTTLREAIAPGAPELWPAAGNNIVAETRYGDQAAVEAAFAKAAHVVSLDLVNQRLAPVSMEPRVVLAEYDGASDRFTIRMSTQMPSGFRDQLCKEVLDIPTDRVRVLVGDVGGGFGMKTGLYAEDAVVAFAARRLGRPVRWAAERMEDFLAALHGRDTDSKAELALDEAGKVLGLRVRTLANMGGYTRNSGVAIQLLIGPWVSTSIYDITNIDFQFTAVLTNTAPTGPYRGAGRPEAIYIIERLMDAAARKLALDPAELRRRNMIRPEQMPYKNAMGQSYDSGSFEKIMAQALVAADWQGFAARAAQSAEAGKLRGRGIATFLEWTGGNVFEERVTVAVKANREIEIYATTQAMGQGIATSYAQLAVDVFGVSLDNIKITMGDSDRGSGFGSAGSRSLFTAGSAVKVAADKTVDKARDLAADALEVAPVDLEYLAGAFQVAGTDRRIGLFELAAKQPEGRIFIDSTSAVSGPTWPNGCHIAEVEIDPDTGEVAIPLYVSTNDAGRVVNPLIVEGQVVGGALQGIGQALCEAVIYDPATGQPLTASFMDYTLPRADMLPSATTLLDQSIPCRTNPLGVKGVGELGTIGATPALVNAVADALARNGRGAVADSVQMPLTPPRIWALLQG
ncbi:MAG: xanthine dehydrogenase family protein molybdopterin-binding subunit [Roseomonas sp.]|nr:xanthine dehydrogenase family protein molybdopterin-binding subunit [Roseomonas sp.]MCA3326758.1 xanthine dehydrogenase family protein molybdopterin-binding subunit [Roseomonas sp.]MCA3329547.1 xanthine dehydrogenase family protein molybdopterin-binding subunit [Roseomonas sp.]MCA3333451.1 xanthine dehydrogenase family protein molybdopterin-binding subunit [Roseomonas sp.]MCA3346324.1 xanthine dehydrogenase family protein molybdopterin-binding subunit [Roseomonas sp.]